MSKKTIRVGDEIIELPTVRKTWIYLGVVVIFGLWLVFSAFYTVGADEVGVIQRFGKYTRTTEPGLHFKMPFAVEIVKKVKVQRVFKEEFGFRTAQAGVRTEYSRQEYSGESLMLTGDPIKEAGLHFKLPFIQDVTSFDKRVLEWDGDENQIPTSDKKYIWVDTFARWRIVDPLKFYQSVNNERNAQSRLDDIIDSATRNFVSENLLIEAVRNSNRELQITTEEAEGFGLVSVVQQIEKGRKQITKLILQKAAETMPQYGIELLDMRIKRINYIEEVRQKVYERMISERKCIAEKFRSEGQGRKAEIDGEREKELQRITSEAYRKAQVVKGKADAEATRTYAGAFNKGPEFYAFLKTLETYKNTLNNNNATLILNTNSDFLKYLKSIKK